MDLWLPQSWQDLTCEQLPQYPDIDTYEQTIRHLNELPPLVAVDEIERLRYYLSQAADNKEQEGKNAYSIAAPAFDASWH